MIVTDLKKEIYDILAKLKYPIYDNPYIIPIENRQMPYLQIYLSHCQRIKYRNAFRFNIRYKIHIFSDYDGEEEILRIEEEMFDAMQDLYKNEFVTYFRESGFNIIDDKSTGTLKKHGLVTYIIVVAGGCEQEQGGIENEINTSQERD